jgi:vacuolar-type H+-ATPase catalytic subunit A/Vma1
MFRYDTIGPMIAYNIEKDYKKTRDKSLAISLLEHYIKPIIALYKEGKEESAIVKFGQMEDVLEECYNFNNSFSNVQEIEKIKKKALIDNIWNKY